MTGSVKQKTLIFLGLVTMAIIIIAISLPQLELKPGMPLPQLSNGWVIAPPAEENPFVSIAANRFVIILIGIVLGVTTLYGMYKMLRGADWKTIAVIVRSMLFIGALACGVIFLIMMVPSSESSAPAEMPLPTPEPVVRAPLGAVPPSLLWIVGIGLFIITIVVAAWIILSQRQPKPLDLVGLEAEKAWQALKTGVDLKDVIVKCYRQMSLAFEKDQGLERKDFMTTGEFESLLESHGIPHNPIHELTRLFNAVRYGNWKPNPADEQKAIQCLEEIMLYSRKNEDTN